MNATFETVRRELKKYNAEDNDAPIKLLVADRNDFLNIPHKRKNSQFILGVKEFHEAERFLVDRLLDDLEMRSGRRPLAFLYNEREVIETVIKDFEDYYNMPLGTSVFQRIGTGADGELQFYLIIVVLEIYYYQP